MKKAAPHWKELGTQCKQKLRDGTYQLTTHKYIIGFNILIPLFLLEKLMATENVKIYQGTRYMLRIKIGRKRQVATKQSNRKGRLLLLYK